MLLKQFYPYFEAFIIFIARIVFNPNVFCLIIWGIVYILVTMP